MVALVRLGRTPESLSREFEPSAQSIRSWVEQSDRDADLRTDGLTSVERDELRRLRRDNKLTDRAGNLGKSRGLVHAENRFRAEQLFAFVSANRALYPFATQCRVLGVSPGGY